MSNDKQADEALIALLGALKARSYQFTTVGNPTHRRVTSRPGMERGRTLRDAFGWSLAFDPDEFDPTIMALLQRSGFLLEHEHGVCNAIRVSSLDGDLFAHSRWPANKTDAVFFGPDTYRFAAFVRSNIPPLGERDTIIDLGTGSGAGGIVAKRAAPHARTILSDVNPVALRLAAVNAAAAGLEVRVAQASGADAAPPGVSVILANPPFIAGDGGRTYRDGGDTLHGSQMSLDWIREGLPKLAPGGRLLMYTGATIVEGNDEFFSALSHAIDPGEFELQYQELDPDIFGSELARAAYRDAERIAAVGVKITRQP